MSLSTVTSSKELCYSGYRHMNYYDTRHYCYKCGWHTPYCHCPPTPYIVGLTK